MAFFIRKARALDTGIRNTEKIFSYIGMFFLFVMMLLGAGDVIGRYIFNHPIFGAMHFGPLMMGLVVFFGWAYVLAERGHVGVDLVFRHYPPRAQAIISFATLFLSLVLFILIAWRTAVIAIVDWQTGRLFEIILLPVAPYKLFIIVGAFLVCLECIIQMVHLYPAMRKKES